MEKRLILTAASPAYEHSLLALIGSLNVNWRGHPRVLVYDLGMSEGTLKTLAKAKIEVRKVPEFCPHWRKHFTWKIWCCCDAPSEMYLWLDAGICVLRPIDEAFVSMEKLGYFCPTNNWPLRNQVCATLLDSCGNSAEDIDDMLSINGGVHGFLKRHSGEKLINRALDLALIEGNMRATEPLHRHDQALLSLLMYKYFDPVLFADGQTYAGWQGPNQVHGQKVWVHRGRMLPEDIGYFCAHIDERGDPHIPEAPPIPDSSLFMRLRIKIAKLRGRYPFQNKSIYDGITEQH